MKRLIYQVYVGPRTKLYDFCTESVARYCRKHGFDHIIQDELILKIVPDLATSGRSTASWQRHGGLVIYEKENAFAYLDRYDQIAIIDSDIYVRENAPNVFDELTDGTEFAAVIEREMPLTRGYVAKITSYSKEQYSPLTDVDWRVDGKGYEFANMGLMVFDKSIQKYLGDNTPLEFIRRPEFKRFVDGVGLWKWSTDQTLLNYWIRKEKMNFKRLNWRWNALYKGIEDIYLKESHFIHFFLKDHLPGKGEDVQQIISLQGLA